MRLLAHVIALRPTPAQITLFKKAAGCARLAYNWGLAQWNSQHAAGEKPNWMTLQKSFVSRIDAEFPFMREVPSSAYSQPFRHLHQAFQRFFDKTGRRPRFKSKRRETPSFKAGKVRFSPGHVILPVIGAVRSCEALRWAGRVVSSTVRADADGWTISVLCEVPEEVAAPATPGAPSTSVVGIDLGLSTFATCSTGQRYDAPKPLRRYAKRMSRAARRLSRRQPGSHRRWKARVRVARLHRRIRRIRSAFLHKCSTTIVRENQTLVIEDLSVQNMLGNHRLARAISDAGWSEFRRQLVYKSVRYQRTLLVAHGFYPSSKLCSQCGNHKPSLTLADRVYACTICGNHMDRDLNAAINLNTLVQRGIDARGELSALVSVGCLPDQPARRSVNRGAPKRVKKDQTGISV